MSKVWPETLLDKSVYSHPVDDLRLIETHISWVVLTGPFAYKIKKPVNLGFLDFTTLALRRHYCERELALNRRFCRDLYLDVVPVTGTWQQPRIDGNGRIFDYAVKMRQFDNRQLADNLARKGQLNDDLVRRMAKTLARLHDELPSIGETSEYGFAKNFYAAAMENFSQIRAYSLPREIQQSLAALEQWTGTTYQRNRPLLEQRRREGYVKDCHGDCHLGNIVILDGEITLFDCIEFNDSFRIQDTLSEAAFLSMDLCARNLPEQSQRFVNSYLEYCGDYNALSLLNLFRCYYALVRAKVYLLRQPAPNQPAITAATHGEFYRYVTLAERFTEKNTAMLVLMHGLSGAGKSYVAEKVAAKFNAIRIRSDVERKRLFHLAPELPGTHEPNLYSTDASRRTFDRLLALSQSIVAAGFGCIVDATFLSRAAREPFIHWATRENIPLVILHCDASEAVILQRLRERASRGGDPSDADAEIYRRQQSTVEPLSIEEGAYLINIDTEQADCVDFAVAQLTSLVHDNQSAT